MIYLAAFLYCGLVCGLGQLFLDNTKFTPGHLTSMLVVLGAVFSSIGWYDVIVANCGAGASTLILSFGNLLFDAAYSGFKADGFLGLFSNMLTTSSAGITSAIVIGAFLAIFFKAKD